MPCFIPALVSCLHVPQGHRQVHGERKASNMILATSTAENPRRHLQTVKVRTHWMMTLLLWWCPERGRITKQNLHEYSVVPHWLILFWVQHSHSPSWTLAGSLLASFVPSLPAEWQFNLCAYIHPKCLPILFPTPHRASDKHIFHYEKRNHN